jgi:hypothetical protein
VKIHIRPRHGVIATLKEVDTNIEKVGIGICIQEKFNSKMRDSFTTRRHGDGETQRLGIYSELTSLLSTC